MKQKVPRLSRSRRPQLHRGAGLWLGIQAHHHVEEEHWGLVEVQLPLEAVRWVEAAVEH